MATCGHGGNLRGGGGDEATIVAVGEVNGREGQAVAWEGQVVASDSQLEGEGGV